MRAAESKEEEQECSAELSNHSDEMVADPIWQVSNKRKVFFFLVRFGSLLPLHEGQLHESGGLFPIFHYGGCWFGRSDVVRVEVYGVKDMDIGRRGLIVQARGEVSVLELEGSDTV